MMAQTERVTLKAVKNAELIHDEFDEAIADGRITEVEVQNLRILLDLNLLTTSLADSAVNVSVSAIRGGVGTRHHNALVADFCRLHVQVSEHDFEPLDAA